MREDLLGPFACPATMLSLNIFNSGCRAVQKATSRINTPAPANNMVRLHLLTAPENAWEMAKNAALGKNPAEKGGH